MTSKTIITILPLILNLGLTNNASANNRNSVFSNESMIPTELQTQILDYLKSNCAGGISDFGLQEKSAKIFQKQISENSVLNQFHIQFKSKYYPDFYHPSTQDIEVQINQKVEANIKQNPEIYIVKGNCTQN